MPSFCIPAITEMVLPVPVSFSSSRAGIGWTPPP
jgi:hypothetical protein